MAESELRRRLRERREREAYEATVALLAGVATGRTLAVSDTPEWVRLATWQFWDTSTPPDATLPVESDPVSVDAWISTLLRTRGLTRPFVSARLGMLPWVECDSTRTAWISHVRRAIEDPWVFLSTDLDCVVAVLEEEYYFTARIARKADQVTTPDRSDSRPPAP